MDDDTLNGIVKRINDAFTRNGTRHRDPERIGRILVLIGEVWMKNPDLRLGQMIENAKALGYDRRIHNPKQPVGYMPDIFSVEDTIIEAGLKELLKR
jgi:hypothetical protein